MRREDSRTISPAIQLKRAYESPESGDGVRVLVDRLWTRGVSKDDADLDAWMKELGPTAELRKWFGHRSERWNEFTGRYLQELATPLRQLLLAELQGIARGPKLTLVYGARDTKENEAVVLRHYLLHETAHSGANWSAAAKLLFTIAALADAHHDAIAPSASLTQFASPILTGQEIDDGLKYLLSNGLLRQSSDGWRVTANGLRRIRQQPDKG